MTNNVLSVCDFCENKAETPYRCFLADLDFDNEKPFIDDGKHLRICFECVQAYSGNVLCGPDQIEHLLVVEHDDFPTVERRVVEIVKEMKCSHCSQPLCENPDARFTFARRALRTTPELLTDPEVYAKWICAECANDCQSCENGDERLL